MLSGEKIFVTNRKGQRVAVLLEVKPNQKGLAFIMHGLGGNKDSAMQVALNEECREAGYTTVRFDTTNTFGESDGRYEDATTTNYYEDLVDVITWAKQQPWYQEPFVLAGYSLGALCLALFAQRHPEQVKALAPLSVVVSGQLSLESPSHASHREVWQRTGWLEIPSATRPGVVKRLPWSHMEDRLKYDLLPQAHRLTMPVFMLVGELDDRTPPQHQQILYGVLPGPKELHVIEEAPHTFGAARHLRAMKKHFRKWLRSLPSAV